jgi:endoglucanase
MDAKSLKIGVNLGGWLSQYKYYDLKHFNSFITETDIQRIAEWGFDHIRLPIDYPVLEDDALPGIYKASGFNLIEKCIDWCQNNGLRLVLDLHKAPGYSFTNTLETDSAGTNSLFLDPAMQSRFINFWVEFARRYKGQLKDLLVFELLNEMVLPDSAPWNGLAQKTIDRIRAIDPERLIIIGGNRYNAPDELVNIAVEPDSNLLYTFHSYEPMVITHQLAPWVRPLRKFKRSVDYPGIAEGLAEFLEANPEYKPEYERSARGEINKALLQTALQPALDFTTSTGQPTYCGEFGVIDRAPLQTRINWTRDIIAIMKSHDIGYAYWSYKAMDFGLVDQKGNVVSDELVRIVSGKA